MKRFLFIFLGIVQCSVMVAQGITTAEIKGRVLTPSDHPAELVSVLALHLPSGTTYGTTTRADGRYSIKGLRVGGPYIIKASCLGYSPSQFENIFLTLGTTEILDFILSEKEIQTSDVVVIRESEYGIRSEKSGTATSVSREMLDVLPSVSRTISDYTRMTPEMKNNSFAGQDSRLNNITLNGAYFNNSFGIGVMPGDRTGVSPISIEALEQIQVNVAPFDIRQGNFTGAGINMVTKSGTNNFASAVYYRTRNERFVGKKAADVDFSPGTFDYNLWGASISGPIARDRIFYSVNFEMEQDVRPGTTFLANDGTQNAGGNITRVLRSDLNALSSFLKKNFQYETGGYERYNFKIPAARLNLKLDYSADEYNHFSISYNHLDSKSDQQIANSASLGFGSRKGTLFALPFQNSNYTIVENIRSITGEWNAVINNTVSNTLILGYRHHNESRESPGKLFPFVDILMGDQVYTSFGTEPFTPFNGLTYSSIQVQNNLNVFLQSHTLLFGASLERFQSEDNFFPGAQSVYVYNSLEDFYTDANDFLAHPDRTLSPINLRKFQVRYSNIPGQQRPLQQLKLLYGGFYAQDEWNARDDIRLTLGLRIDVPYFEKTGYRNTQVEGLLFKDESGNDVKYSTDKMPNANPLYSFRLGFLWEALSSQSLQFRGGTGIFTGQPAFVWISNQIGNNGVLTGFDSFAGTASSPLTNRPFNPDPNAYKPKSVSGQPAPRYELALTDPNFKFPQVWRTTVAVDYKFPWEVLGTVEFLYSKDINGVSYINANQSAPDSVFAGPDNRPRWTSRNKIYSYIDDAIVLKNQNAGYSWNFSASLEKLFQNGFYGKICYSYGTSMNTVDASTVAYVSWYYNTISGNPNNPGISYSMVNPDHRFFTALSYRFEYFDIGSTTVSVFLETSTIGRSSYVYSGDFNGDGVYNNDLIYIPKDKSEMFFKEYTSGGKIFSVDAQKEAWEKYIQQDEYLRSRRGRYAERNGVQLPLLTRMDFSIGQEFSADIFGKRNSFMLRLDVMNMTNLLNKRWGVAQTLLTNAPLIALAPESGGKPSYTLRTINNTLIDKSLMNTASFYDVYRMQLMIKWMLN